MILSDWFSGFSFAKRLGVTSGTDQVIKKLNKIFMMFGYPEHLRSDAGPHFRNLFRPGAEEQGSKAHTRARIIPAETLALRKLFKM